MEVRGNKFAWKDRKICSDWNLELTSEFNFRKSVWSSFTNCRGVKFWRIWNLFDSFEEPRRYFVDHKTDFEYWWRQEDRRYLSLPLTYLIFFYCACISSKMIFAIMMWTQNLLPNWKFICLSVYEERLNDYIPWTTDSFRFLLIKFDRSFRKIVSICGDAWCHLYFFRNIFFFTEYIIN